MGLFFSRRGCAHVFGASCYGYDFRIGQEYLITTIPSKSLDRDREVLPLLLPGEAKSLRRGVARLNCAPEMRKRH